MNPEIQFLPINWKNGMAFSADHLNEQHQAVIDALRDVRALQLTSHNYGILGGDIEKNYADSFNASITSEKVEVHRCRAVTKNGSRVEILDNQWSEVNRPLTELVGSINLDTSPFWYVLLVVDPFRRVPEGIESEQESPRRKPHNRPLYQLELISSKEMERDNLTNALPIAKYENTSAGLRKIDDYIPPCNRVNSHTGLVRKYQQYDGYLTDIKEYALKIMEKIDYKKRNREHNRLVDDINSLCEDYLNHLANTYDSYKLLTKEAPPIHIVHYFARMARVFDNSMDMAHDSSHLLRYFREYTTDIEVAQLSKIIRSTYSMNYQHYDIAFAFEVIDTFIGTFHDILMALVKLDYKELAARKVVKQDTYHGQEKQHGLTRRKILVKHQGGEERLGDELDPD